MRVKFLAQGNNRSLWLGSNSPLIHYKSDSLPHPAPGFKLTTDPLQVRLTFSPRPTVIFVESGDLCKHVEAIIFQQLLVFHGFHWLTEPQIPVSSIVNLYTIQVFSMMLHEKIHKNIVYWWILVLRLFVFIPVLFCYNHTK